MMNRWSLYLPVCLLGIPLLVCLLLASAPFGEKSAFKQDSPPPVITGEGPLPDNAHMDKLAQEDPVAFLENCLRRYQRKVKGYSVTMQKQERLDGKLQKTEKIEAHFKEQPHSIYFRWMEGARRAERALYVEGENDGMMLAVPSNSF